MSRPHARGDWTGRRAAERRIREENRAGRQAPVPSGVVAAAIAERSSGQPLVVQTLEQRLEAALPGAWLVDGGIWVSASERWTVSRSTRRLAAGPSAREAVDKAIALHGGRR